MTPIELSHPAFHDEEAARQYLESVRWPDGPFCPFCGLFDHVRALGGKSMGPGWYHCTECRKKFTVRVGSLFERSHIPLHKWLMGFRLMASSKKGVSAHQLHRTLNITYKSAWFLAHRIREAMRESGPGPLGGEGKVVEADETFFGAPDYVFVNGKGWQTRGTGTKYKILSLVERGGRARSVKVENLTSAEIRHALVTNLSRKSRLHTDEAQHYKAPGREFAKHEAVNHSAEEYARGDVTTNTVEGYFSIFKRGMKGIYQHCSEKHLQRYLHEFDFRYSNRSALGVEDTERTALAIRGADCKRLTYRQPRKRANG
ncbi:MAG TPA: IS1595 family transposase [Stellaceae bacterium]|nr:IS1595 family transposase [Stellaceae bacterium]